MHGNKESGEALSLSKVRVKALIQRQKHTLTNLIICIRKGLVLNVSCICPRMHIAINSMCITLNVHAYVCT